MQIFFHIVFYIFTCHYMSSVTHHMSFLSKNAKWKRTIKLKFQRFYETHSFFYDDFGVLSTNSKSKNCRKAAFSRYLNFKFRKFDETFILFYFFAFLEISIRKSKKRSIVKITYFFSNFLKMFRFLAFFGFLNEI